MTRKEFLELCRQGVVLDGAYGTELAKRGFPGGCCPELWSFEHPEVVCDIVRSYCRAGSRLLYAPTFGGNRFKLAEYRLSGRVRELNEGLCRIARNAAAEYGAAVFADLAPTGKFVEPYGEVAFDEAVEAYREQAAACIAGGAEGVVIETMMDLQEVRAAYLGAREAAPDMPVMVTMTFDESGRSLTGADPMAALNVVQHLGADAFGCNCSTGPERMAALLRRIRPYAGIPLVAKPNAGLPRLDAEGRTVFPMDAKEFAAWAAPLRESGVALFGGCCGTTPAHIAALADALKALEAPLAPAGVPAGMLSSVSRCHVIAQDAPLTVVGERINPTGKKALQAELRAGSTELIADFARQQSTAGAQVLDVNMGLAGIDEMAMMASAIARLVRTTDTPLCIDSTDPAVVERALRLYPGRALLNSIPAEKARMAALLPIAARYGAMPILLPVTDKGIPETAGERIAVIEELVAAAQEYGIARSELCIDPLIMTVSANPQAANVALEVVSWCRRHGLNSICGLSNVSFGLPGRRLLNSTFLGMAMGCGLNAAIANPLFPEIMDAVAAGDALGGRDGRQQRFIDKYGNATAPAAAAASSSVQMTPAQRLGEMVVNGDEGGMAAAVQALLDEGSMAPLQIIQEVLVPAITEVGRRYEAKQYFLPQLIAGAEAMQRATELLQRQMPEGDGASGKPKFVIATVQGDIHDIGKNIVAVMLRNYGFDVIDLGKDVPPERILETAVAENAAIVGLSALMTTTVGAMRRTIQMASERGLCGQLHFIIGGAVVDQALADELGAEYGADPMSTVRAARRLAGLPPA